MALPAWLGNKQVVVTETENGYVISPKADSPLTECVSFDTWDATSYCLTLNFAPRPAQAAAPAAPTQ